MTDDVVLISSDEEDDGDPQSNLNLEEQLDPVIIISDDDEDVAGGDEEKYIDDEDYVVLISDDGDGDDERESDEQVSDALRDKLDCFLQGSKALQESSLYECESYLRKHGIRVSGTKEECIQRIEEHKRLKAGHGESLYPISSFSINCTGDACRGDVVLFKQHIKKGLNIVGKRTVTGRIIEESYGESDQQHTFSVEVLWSKRYKKVNPLSILLVKGRHLYSLGTFRQPWGNEAERLEVLAEKHCRGDAARLKRKLRQTEFGCNNYKGAKRQKVSHIVSFQIKEPIQIDKQKSAKKGGAASLKESTSAHKRKAVPVWLQKLKFKRSAQLTFRLDPKPNLNRNRKRNLNPNLNIHSDHHLQEVSSFFPNDRSLVSCGCHSNGNWGPKRVFYQPSGYHDHNYEQPIPRFRSLYARSSFSINCMGDACIGDVVLFNQNKIRRGNITGMKSTVAGRIVGENYGASEKQHTFTVEVLWTKGYLKLSPLSTLQVKAWNLYRFGTFRQPWKNEQKRSKVLRRKHRRLEAVRHKHTLRKACIASINNKAIKRQKVSHKGPSQSKQSTQTDKQEYAKRLGAAIVKKSTTHKRKAVGFQKTELQRAAQLTFYSDPTPISNPNPNLTPSPISKPNSTPNPEPNPSPNRNLNPKTTLKPNQNLTLSPNSNQNPSANSNPNQKPTSNPHLSPNLNHHMYSDCHLQEASSSATLFYHYDRTLLPNQPAPGFSRNQPHSRFSHDQPHPGFSCDQPHRGFSRNQPPYGFSRNQPPDGFLRNQPPYGFSLHNQPPFQPPYGFSLHNQTPFQPPFGLPFEFSGYVEQWVRNDIFHEPPGRYSMITDGQLVKGGSSLQLPCYVQTIHRKIALLYQQAR